MKIKEHYKFLGKKRWAGIPENERKRIMSKTGKAGWDKLTILERKERIDMLKNARMKAVEEKANLLTNLVLNYFEDVINGIYSEVEKEGLLKKMKYYLNGGRKGIVEYLYFYFIIQPKDFKKILREYDTIKNKRKTSA